MNRAALALIALLALTLPAAARGDGLPVVGVDADSSGVAAGGLRYVVLPAEHGTIVAAIAQRGGRIQRRRYLPQALGIPAVAYDGSAAGLSHDGGTLALIRPRTSFPQRATRLVVLDARTLAVRRRVDLRGDFSFDAISPDGGALYLIHYQSPTDPTRYEVRVFDVAAGRLDPTPVVDPREPDERMGGIPVTRAASADGRWAYTLYQRPGGVPFVHALDTGGHSARCIDMPMLTARKDLGALRLRAGRALTVLAGSRAVATVDLRTYRASRAATRARDASPGGGGSGSPWVLAAVLLVVGVLAAAGRRGLTAARRSATSAP